MCDNDDDVPLFTEESARRYKANLAATATVKAATGMSDDDDDVPLFDEKALAKHAASLHATGACRTTTTTFHCSAPTRHAQRIDVLNNKIK